MWLSGGRAFQTKETERCNDPEEETCVFNSEGVSVSRRMYRK